MQPNTRHTPAVRHKHEVDAILVSWSSSLSSSVHSVLANVFVPLVLTGLLGLVNVCFCSLCLGPLEVFVGSLGNGLGLYGLQPGLLVGLRLVFWDDLLLHVWLIRFYKDKHWVMLKLLAKEQECGTARRWQETRLQKNNRNQNCTVRDHIIGALGPMSRYKASLVGASGDVLRKLLDGPNLGLNSKPELVWS